MPQVRKKEEKMIPYQIVINLRFDQIIKYEFASEISYDLLLIYLGSLFGLLICLQKLFVYCYVRPIYKKYLHMQLGSSAPDFDQRVNNIESYRVHKYCEL